MRIAQRKETAEKVEENKIVCHYCKEANQVRK